MEHMELSEVKGKLIPNPATTDSLRSTIFAHRNSTNIKDLRSVDNTTNELNNWSV